MPRIVLVRHAEAAAGWGDDADPGLSALGAEQAKGLADALAAEASCPIVVSPLRRTRETAAPLAERWGVEPTIDPRIGEIESPTTDLGERGAWLAGVMAGRWTDQDEEQRAWADRVVAAVCEQAQDSVLVTHFVAINVVVGRALGDDRVLVRRVANASRTIVQTDGGRLVSVEVPADVEVTQVL